MPNAIMIAGPNGSGKTTSAKALLRDYLEVTEFVNADVIAQGLSGFGYEDVAFAAGQIMLGRLKELAANNMNFAFETTLAAKSFSPWLRELQSRGYQAHLYYFWLPNPEMSVNRVASRVAAGGHNVPADFVRRRYHGGLKNFFSLYRLHMDKWRFMDNSSRKSYRLIAERALESEVQIYDLPLWRSLEERYA